MQLMNKKDHSATTSLYLQEQLNQLAKQAPNVLVSALAIGAIVLFLIRDMLASVNVMLWAGMLLAANLLLLLWILVYRRVGIKPTNLRISLYSYQLQTFLHGLVWGTLPFILMEVKTPELQFLTYYVICGMAAGAVATTGMIYRVYLSFMLPILLPVIVYQLIDQNSVIFDNEGLGILIIFFFAMISLSHVHYEGLMRGIRLMFENDVLLDELREAYQRAESASRAKMEFLSNMSHELRTPLNAIMGFSSLLIKFSQHKRPDKTREFAANINEAGRHLSDLINQVLDLTSIETGDTSVNLKPLSLTEIMQECVQLLRPMASEHEVVLLCEYGQCIGDKQFVLADAMRLRQVLINLVSNAIKYNTKDGMVILRCVHQNSSIMVEVSDTGLGIAAADQRTIFTPFVRAHMETKIEGTGIGLAVTKKNLQLMHSNIEFQSVEGKGSRFWFFLPTTEAPEPLLVTTPSSAAQQISSHKAGHIKVLYVEDNPIGMRLMEVVMGTHEDISFYQAATGEEGYAVALKMLPQIIILDINLPDINGLEVLRRIRSHPSMQKIPIIALSASALDEEVRKGLQAGFSRYLRKPFEPEELMSMVYELAQSQ